MHTAVTPPRLMEWCASMNICKKLRILLSLLLNWLLKRSLICPLKCGGLLDECEVSMISIAEFIINIAISNLFINDLLLSELSGPIDVEMDDDIRMSMLDAIDMLTIRNQNIIF